MNLNDHIIDIKSIVHFLTIQNKQPIRELKYKDFLHKFHQIPKNMNTDKEKVDVAIFVSNIMELNAFNDILHFKKSSSREYKNINGLRIWNTCIKRKDKDALNIIITCIGEAGNISCSLACMRIFDFFDIKFAVLSGITAGLKARYSVIFSDGIVDYEHQRLEPTQITYRPEPIMVSREIKRSTTYYIDRLELFKNEAKRICANKINATEFDIEQLNLIELHVGIIASGEKLFADGITLNDLAQKILIKKGIIGGEMEGSGFANSCNEFNIPWIVIKGISDDGGDEKDSLLNKKYQFVAAINSAIATTQFLELDYRNEDDYDEF